MTVRLVVAIMRMWGMGMSMVSFFFTSSVGHQSVWNQVQKCITQQTFIIKHKLLNTYCTIVTFSEHLPPDAKLSRTFSMGWRSGELSIGIKKRMMKGATLIRRVEPKASVQSVTVLLLGSLVADLAFSEWWCSWCLGSCFFICGAGAGGWFACLEYLKEGRSSTWSCEWWCPPWWSCPWWSCEWWWPAV